MNKLTWSFAKLEERLGAAAFRTELEERCELGVPPAVSATSSRSAASANTTWSSPSRCTGSRTIVWLCAPSPKPKVRQAASHEPT